MLSSTNRFPEQVDKSSGVAIQKALIIIAQCSQVCAHAKQKFDRWWCVLYKTLRVGSTCVVSPFLQLVVVLGLVLVFLVRLQAPDLYLSIKLGEAAENQSILLVSKCRSLSFPKLWADGWCRDNGVSLPGLEGEMLLQHRKRVQPWLPHTVLVSNDVFIETPIYVGYPSGVR